MKTSYRHSDYSRTTLRADVCVVQLRVTVLWLPNVRRVCLPGETLHPDPSVECFVPSWGYVSTGEVRTLPIHEFLSNFIIYWLLTKTNV